MPPSPPAPPARGERIVASPLGDTTKHAYIAKAYNAPPLEAKAAPASELAPGKGKHEGKEQDEETGKGTGGKTLRQRNW